MQEDNKDRVPHPHPLPHPDQTRQGQYVDSLQTQGSSSQDTLKDITKKINTQFGWCGWYMCLMYFELVLSIFGVVMTAIAENQVHGTRRLFVLDVMFVTCVTAFTSKLVSEKLLQFGTFVLFTISTVASFGLLIAEVWTEWIPIFIVALGIQSFVGILLVFESYSLYQLMRDRYNIHSDFYQSVIGDV